MATSECSHDCETKNIILLGCTQAGKSQFLKSLLTYGGFTEAASSVETGNGNRSKTQKCSSNTYEFEPKEHTLHSKTTGKPCSASHDYDPSLIFTSEQSTGTHVHLNIIDTPGLSDSENDGRSLASEESKSMGGTRMASVDERHKISILVSLLQAQRVHAVCLMKPKGAYSASLQRYLRYIISIFQISLPQVAWSLHIHVVHTSIYASDRFGPRLKVAENEFKRLFGMDAMHHFVDSDPILDDAQSVYFSNCAISNFLFQMREQSSFLIASLKYRKEDAHIANDQILRSSFTELQTFHRACIDEAKGIQNQARKGKIPLKQFRNLYDSQANRIEADIALLNKPDRVLVNEDSCEVGRSIPGGNHRFVLNSKSEIAYPVEKEKSNGNWESEIQGTYTYATTLSVPWMEKATASVKIYSLKSSVEAGKISELQKDLQDVQNQQSETKSKLQSLDRTISEEGNKIAAHNKEIKALSDAAALLSTCTEGAPYFDISKYGADLKYFTAAATYAASLGYGLTNMVPRERLPPTCVPSDSARAALRRKRKELEHTLKALSIATSKVASRIKSFDTFAKHLETMGQRLDATFSAITLEKDLSTTSPVSFSDVFVMHDPGAGAPFEKSDLYARAGITESYIVDATSYLAARRKFELKRLHEERTEVCQAAANLQVLDDKSKKLQAVFVAQQKHTKCGIKALKQTVKWLDDERLPIGAFAVLRQAASDELKEPWLRLWSEVTEAESLRDYRCGLEKNVVNDEKS